MRKHIFIVVLLVAVTTQFETLERKVRFDDASPHKDDSFIPGKVGFHAKGFELDKLAELSRCIVATQSLTSTMSDRKVLKYTLEVSEAVSENKNPSMVKRPNIPKGFENVVSELESNVKEMKTCSESRETASMTYIDMVNEYNKLEKKGKKPIIGLRKTGTASSPNRMRPLPPTPVVNPKETKKQDKKIEKKKTPPVVPPRKDLLAKKEHGEAVDYTKSVAPPVPVRKDLEGPTSKKSSFSNVANFWKQKEKGEKAPKVKKDGKKVQKQKAPVPPPRNHRSKDTQAIKEKLNNVLSHKKEETHEPEPVVEVEAKKEEKEEKKEKQPDQVNFFLKTKAKGFYKTEIKDGRRVITGDQPYTPYNPGRISSPKTYKSFHYLFIHDEKSSAPELQKFQFLFQRVIENRRLVAWEKRLEYKKTQKRLEGLKSLEKMENRDDDNDFELSADELSKTMDPEVAVSGANFLIKLFRALKETLGKDGDNKAIF